MASRAWRGSTTSGAAATFITLHTPMTAETRNLIGPREIALMKPSVRIINCARGGLIDETALAEALNSGKVAGAAIDVFEPEPPPADHPLVGHPLVVVTPHLGASTEEAQVSVAVEAARLLSDFLARGQVRFAVNMPALDKAELDDVRLYLNLAWRLGMLHSQMDRGTLKNARITYRGEVAHKNTKLITASFAAGLMEAALEQQVNLVNATPLARERGIVIEERSAEAPGDFATLIQTEVTTERKAYAASGTLFGKQFLRLVRLGDLLARRTYRWHALDLHAHGPSRPDRLHRRHAGRRGGQHRPDERRPRAPRGRGDRRRQPRQCSVEQGPGNRAAEPRYPEPERDQAAAARRRAVVAGGVKNQPGRLRDLTADRARNRSCCRARGDVLSRMISSTTDTTWHINRAQPSRS